MTASHTSSSSPLWVVLLITFVFYAGIYGLATRHYHFNSSVLVDVGDQVVPYGSQPIGHNVVVFKHSDGYDGQLYYYVADDPLPMIRQAQFRNAFRYQRILYPLLTAVVSLGQINARPLAMVGINIVAVLACAWLAWLLARTIETTAAIKRPATLEERLNENVDRPRISWWILLAVLNPSLVLAFQLDLTEPLAMAFSLGGLLAWYHRKIGWSSLLFALALLTREVAVLLLLPIVADAIIRRRWQAAIIMILSFVPYLGWQVALARTLNQVGASGSTSNFGTPFGGVLAVLRNVGHALRQHQLTSLLVHQGSILIVMVILVGIVPLAIWHIRLRGYTVVAGTLLVTCGAGILAASAIWEAYASAARVFGIVFPMLALSLVSRHGDRKLALVLCIVAAGLTVLTVYRDVAISPVLSYFLTP